MQQYLVQTLGISQHELETGGLTIRTTLEPELQRAGDAAVLNTLPLDDPRVATFNAVQPGTGHLLALSMNRTFGYDVDDPTQESYNLNVAPSRGAGSTYKVFVAAAALARGFSDSFTLTAPSPYRSRVYKEAGGPYEVENAGRYRATLDLTTALYQSSNTYFVALEDALGSVEEPVRMAERMGLYQFGQADLAQEVIDENRGRSPWVPTRRAPRAGQRVLDAGRERHAVRRPAGDRDPGPRREAARRRRRPAGADGRQLHPEAIPPGVATTLNQMLRKDVEPGNPGQTAPAAYVRGHQIAGKTGTAQGNVSVSFVGYTPEIAASVMVFDPKRNRDVGGSAAARARPSGGTRWRRSCRRGAAATSRRRTRRWSTATPSRCPAAVRRQTASACWRRPASRARRCGSTATSRPARSSAPARPEGARRARRGGHDPGQQRSGLRRAGPGTGTGTGTGGPGTSGSPDLPEPPPPEPPPAEPPVGPATPPWAEDLPDWVPLPRD
ncbi:penicillin-binding transpeptidase domain-containing protein [Blastococcus brunescens]|uniref:Penicillin-binding transpeptidase domain-containing protein n=1 Tax=Blastococcus brunescens TaxID=1564165 RepID=A0ABZ1AZ85_9ACTN|nr:penicillin-binding transpeptidase domain-containing protein [Blastococcus sp. BMG 8361]WRL63437.1 penicillin-binding transpeptidase domain-containing protein [Blastococcus sp. BMG 8361]